MKDFYYQFPSPVIFRVAGKDSERYLQARLTNDIKRLSEKQSLIAACLTPQGKTKALFRVYREAAQDFILLSLSGDAAQIRQDLGCFIVADRVEIQDVSREFHLFAFSQSAVLDLAPEDIVLSDPYLKLTLVITSLTNAWDVSSYQKFSEEDFQLYRLQNSLPEFPIEIPVDSLFPESGIRLAISNTKGCYAGQEVVERVVALGKLPAKILTFKTIEATERVDFLDLQLQDEQGGKVGDVLSICYDPEVPCNYLFARVPTKFQGKTFNLQAKTKKFSLSEVVAK